MYRRFPIKLNYYVQVMTSLQAQFQLCLTSHMLCFTKLKWRHWRKTLTEPYALTYQLSGAKSFLRSQWLLNNSWSSSHFMESVRSFSYSEQPAAVPYPDPEKSSPCPPIQVQDQCSYYQLRLSLTSGLLPSSFHTQAFYVCFSILFYVCYMASTSHSLWLDDSSTNYETHHARFSNRLFSSHNHFVRHKCQRNLIVHLD
jgi:hypothetical protein